MNPGKLLTIVLAGCTLTAQAPQLARVESKTLHRSVTLTGEILPYQAVDLHARVQGFVERIVVDRGSVVRQGEALANLSAPEMDAQTAEAEAKVRAAEASLSESRAKLSAAASTYGRLKEASETPGAISGNELALAEQGAEAAKGMVRSSEAALAAAGASLAALEKTKQYLRIAAPFAGVITERMAHPGALVGPDSGPLLRLEQVSRLRVVVAVPEANCAGIRQGARVAFQVSAHPTRKFEGTITRIARALDRKTRTMPVELEVANATGVLAPGMYPQVSWPVQAAERTLIVPASSVVRTTERVFVVRVKNGRAEWVDVRPGAREDGNVQVFGDLAEGDMVVRNGSDEIREGVPLSAATRP